MAAKNHFIPKLRISKSMDDELTDAAMQLGFRKTDIIRFLLNRSLKHLREDVQKAGGYDNLTFSIRSD